MPPRILTEVLVIDRSPLARMMYPILFSAQNRFRVRFADEYQSLFKTSVRLRPDLILINSNSLEEDADLTFPCPTILLVSSNRFDLREKSNNAQVVMVEKPFYPYELVTVANRLVGSRPKKMWKKRKRE